MTGIGFIHACQICQQLVYGDFDNPEQALLQHAETHLQEAPA